MRFETHQQDLSLVTKLRGDFKVPRTEFMFFLVVALLCVFGGLGFIVNERLDGVPFNIETVIACLFIPLGVISLLAAGVRYRFTDTEVIYCIWSRERKRLSVADIKAVVIALERRYRFLVLAGPDSKQTMKILITEELENAIRTAKGGAFY